MSDLKKLKVTVSTEDGEVLEQQTFLVPGQSEGWAARELIDKLEMNFDFLDEDADEDYDYDGQPDEAQEWHDFDPDC